MCCHVLQVPKLGENSMDMCRTHDRAVAAQAGASVMFLPPYSPDHNTIVGLFGCPKQWYKAHRVLVCAVDPLTAVELGMQAASPQVGGRWITHAGVWFYNNEGALIARQPVLYTQGGKGGVEMCLCVCAHRGCRSTSFYYCYYRKVLFLFHPSPNPGPLCTYLYVNSLYCAKPY